MCPQLASDTFFNQYVNVGAASRGRTRGACYVYVTVGARERGSIARIPGEKRGWKRYLLDGRIEVWGMARGTPHGANHIR
jgi:hypothetical protein